jgi:hypothetical protein
MPRFTRITVGIFSATLFLACMIARSQDASPPASHPSNAYDPATEKQLDRTIPSVRFAGVTFSDAIDFFRDITGINFYVDWKNLKLAGVTPDIRVTVQSDKITIRDALNLLLKATSSDALEFHGIGGVVVISTKLDFQDRQHQEGPYLTSLSDTTAAAPVLNHHIAAVQLPSQPLSDAIDFIRDITGATIEVKWPTLISNANVPMTTPITLQLRDVPLSTVLNLILEQANEGQLGYTVTPVVINRVDQKIGHVQVKTVLITISTIADLKGLPQSPTTKP